MEEIVECIKLLLLPCFICISGVFVSHIKCRTPKRIVKYHDVGVRMDRLYNVSPARDPFL